MFFKKKVRHDCENIILIDGNTAAVATGSAVLTAKENGISLTLNETVKEKKRQCDKCPYNGVQLNRHIKHHKFVENFFKCRYCDYYLSKKSAIYQHEVNHTKYASSQCKNLAKKKKKSCSLCPYKAYNSLQLKCHVSNHEFKEECLKCRYCDYYVLKKSHLIQHEVIHPNVSYGYIFFFIRKLN